jgi:L-lysine 2,3-aminomutase
MTNADTREEWCLHFKNLYSFVKSISEMLEMTSDEWQKSVNSYRKSVAQLSKEITNLIDLEERALALREREMDSVETLLREEERESKLSNS